MKNFLKKYWPVIYTVLVAVTEVANYAYQFDFVPKGIKITVFILAFCGFVAKIAYKKK